MPRTVAIIGAGFGGLGVARLLEPRAEDGDVDVILMEKGPSHDFHALLYEVATGSADGCEEDCEKILASGVAVNLHAYRQLLHGRRARVMSAEVVGIDRLTHRLRLRGGEELSYDALVLALGSETEYYGIPGLREHAFTLKTTADALRIRRRILDGIAGTARGNPMSIVIGGGGATGVEFAAELGNALRGLVHARRLGTSSYSITLVEAASRLLSGFPERLHRVALRRLRELGVRVVLDACVRAAALERVVLVPRPLKDGESRDALLCSFAGPEQAVDADCMVWTGGIRAPALPRDAGFPCDAKGRVLVGEDFLVAGETHVFALGDCAAFTNPWTHAILPPLAAVAVREAPTVAANVLARLDDRPLLRFRPRELPAIVPLGGKRAGFAYRGWTWVGRIPWVLHTLVALWYFCGVVGMIRGWRMWWRGARMYVQNDA